MKTKKVLKRIELLDKTERCPRCGATNKRHSTVSRKVRVVGGVYDLRVARYFCLDCRKFYTNSGVLRYTEEYGRYSHNIIKEGIKLLRAGNTLEQAAAKLSKKCGHTIRDSTLHDWMRKKEPQDVV
jgi:transposase-like protein